MRLPLGFHRRPPATTVLGPAALCWALWLVPALPGLAAPPPADTPATPPPSLVGPPSLPDRVPPPARSEASSPAVPESAAAKTTPAKPAVENSVAKIFVTARYPDLSRPWTKQPSFESSGSGVIIEGRRILTNAHVVLYAGQIQVQANGAGERFDARVEAVGPGIDLAVLRLENADDEARLFEGRPPLARATALPSVRDPVLAYGFPTGGNNLSITKGIVSRLEFVPYNHSVSGLRIQIDAAINPGNSGGPVVQDEKMVGLAFSRLAEHGAQGIGYIIPNEEVERFLHDAARGRPENKPAMFDQLQPLENPALRTFLKLDRGVHGVVVHQPLSDAPDYPLKEWDVITAIGDTPVDDEGMVRVGPEGVLRLRFEYLVPRMVSPADQVPLTVLRDGRERKVNLSVGTRRSLVLPHLDAAYPSYFICGPLVFEEATAEFAEAAGWMGSGQGMMLAFSHPDSPLIHRLGDQPTFDGERLVFVPAPFFPHRLVNGYANPVREVVKAVDGVPIRNLAHLVAVVRDATGKFLTVEFAGRGGETLILPRAETLAATEGILTDNGVRAQGSPDVLAVWGAKEGLARAER